jgi:hypothetical protein
MALEVWPVAVPNEALIGTYTERPNPVVDEFRPEQGPPIQGIAGSIQTDLVSYAIMLTNTQRAALMTFWRTTLSQGTEYFTATNPAYGGTETFRFVDPPEAQSQSTRTAAYRVEIRLERLR